MKSICYGVCLVAFAVSVPSFAQSTLPEGVVVQQEKAQLTTQDIDGRLAQIPPDKRAGVMNSPDRIEELLRNLLMTRQLAQQAEELGIADDAAVQAEIARARDDILARRRVARFMNALPTPDFSVLAKERYIANPGLYSTKEAFDVRNLLIMHRNHGVEQAKKIAADLLEQFKREGGDFEAFVKAHSEEKDVEVHGGLLEGMTKGDTEADFEKAMFALTKPGELSGVVVTKYGAHLIQLVAHRPSKRIPFEEAKQGIVDQLASDYRERERASFLTRLRSGKLDANPDLVQALRTRYLPDGPGSKAISASEQPAAGEYERFATSVSVLAPPKP